MRLGRTSATGNHPLWAQVTLSCRQFPLSIIEGCGSRFSLPRGRWPLMGFERGMTKSGRPARFTLFQPFTGGSCKVGISLRRGNGKIPDTPFIRRIASRVLVYPRCPTLSGAAFREQTGDGPEDTMFPISVSLRFLFRHRRAVRKRGPLTHPDGANLRATFGLGFPSPWFLRVDKSIVFDHLQGPVIVAAGIVLDRGMERGFSAGRDCVVGNGVRGQDGKRIRL